MTRFARQARHLVEALGQVEDTADAIAAAVDRVAKNRRDRDEGVIIMREVAPGVFSPAPAPAPAPVLRVRSSAGRKLAQTVLELEQLEQDLNEALGEAPWLRR